VHAHGTRRSAAAARAAAAALPSASAAPGGVTSVRCTTGFVYDARMADHAPPAGAKHFEQPGRVQKIFARLHREGLVAQCAPLGAREATPAELLACHTAEHVAAVNAAVDAATVPPGDDDMYASRETPVAARLAAGCVAAAATAAVAGEVENAFALVRPPGHHAGCCSIQGFCFFNNVAVAARAAQKAGAARVAIVDWDVHHGNGTQDIFWEDPSVLYISLHRFALGFFPGTGAAGETGPASGPGAGATLNVPFADVHLTGADYSAAFALLILPVLREFAPDVLLVSAGFDAALGDPLGKMALTPAAFGALTEALLALEGPARAGGAHLPLVVALEGGYNEDAIAACSEAVVRALLRGAAEARAAAASAAARGASSSGAKKERGTRVATEVAVRAARDAAAPHWRCLRDAAAVAAFDAFWAEEREARPRRACTAASSGGSSDVTAPHAPAGSEADASPVSARRPSPTRGAPAHADDNARAHGRAPAHAEDAAPP
jgi:histone deacetylase 6